jgi:hypothetical protein
MVSDGVASQRLLFGNIAEGESETCCTLHAARCALKFEIVAYGDPNPS